MISLITTRLCKAFGRLVLQMQLVEFSGEAPLQDFTHKRLLGNIKYFVSLKMKSLTSNGFRQNITLSKH